MRSDEYEQARKARLKELIANEAMRRRRDKRAARPTRKLLTHEQRSEIARRNGMKATNRHKLTTEELRRGGHTAGTKAMRQRGREWLREIGRRGGRAKLGCAARAKRMEATNA
jgi:general stress protein YciG